MASQAEEVKNREDWREEMIIKLKVKRLTNTAKLPTQGSEFAAGYDLYASEISELSSGKVSKIKTGISIEIPDGYVALVWPRSGLACKDGVIVLAGVIDSDYRGEVIVALSTIKDEVIYINRGERIAQILIQKIENYGVEEVEELSASERGEGGFGSSGR